MDIIDQPVVALTILGTMRINNSILKDINETLREMVFDCRGATVEEAKQVIDQLSSLEYKSMDHGEELMRSLMDLSTLAFLEELENQKVQDVINELRGK